MARAKQPRADRIALDEVKDRVAELRRLIPNMSQRAANKAVEELLDVAKDIEQLRGETDAIKDPGEAFDPTNPDTAGRLVTLALLSQDRVPLGEIASSYGSGVYAIYYNGPHPIYQKVSGSETPVYVGKADPEDPTARTPREQGPQLYGRLRDHRRMIRQVSAYARANSLPFPLELADFQCRRLVCATNAQLVAEKHLINVFRPIWNSDTKIAFGISKHGDDAETRKNGRSPWDVLHPGRPWAMKSETLQYSETAILASLDAHFKLVPPYANRDDILKLILGAFIQKAPTTAPEKVAVDDSTPSDPQAAFDYPGK